MCRGGGNEAGGNFRTVNLTKVLCECVSEFQVDMHERRMNVFVFRINADRHVEKRIKCVKLIKSRLMG